MRLSSIAVTTAFLITLTPVASASTPAKDACAFANNFAMRSGELPFAGTLDEQIAASMDNVLATSDRFTIDYRFRIGGEKAAHIVTHEGETVREIYYVNHGEHSYQFNLQATPGTYMRQKRNLRTLLRKPFDDLHLLCR